MSGFTLLNWFSDRYAHRRSLIADTKERFELRSYPTYIAEAALMQPWVFVENVSVGDRAAHDYCTKHGLIDGRKHYSRLYSVVFTRTEVPAQEETLDERGACKVDPAATVCWMTRDDKLSLFVHLINTPEARLGTDRCIIREMLPLLFMLQNSEWLLLYPIKDEHSLREKAKRNHSINFLSYYHPRTFTLHPTSGNHKATVFQLTCCAGWIALQQAERVTEVSQQHALLRWLKRALSHPRQGFFENKRMVEELFDNERYKVYRRSDNAEKLQQYREVIHATLVALTTSDPTKEATSSDQGYRFPNNPRYISDRYQWLRLLPKTSVYSTSLHPAANTIRWTTFWSLEKKTVATGDFLVAEKFTLEYKVEYTAYVVFEKATAMQLEPVLREYEYLVRSLSTEQPQLFDLYLDEAVVVMCWNAEAARRLQCLGVCAAASHSVNAELSYLPWLPIAQLLHLDPAQPQIQYYLMGLYLLLAHGTADGSEMHNFIYDQPPMDVEKINQVYQSFVLKLVWADPAVKDPLSIPMQLHGERLQTAIMSLLLPHAMHALHNTDMKMLQEHYPKLARLLQQNFVPGIHTVRPHDPKLHVTPVTVHDEWHVTGHDNAELYKPHWNVLDFDKFIVVLEALTTDGYTIHDMWVFLSTAMAVVPCSTAHLERLLKRVYPSDWTSLTIPVDAEQRAALPPPPTNLDELPGPVAAWLTIHAMLSGLPDIRELFEDGKEEISLSSYRITNLLHAMSNPQRQPVVMRDMANHTDHGLYNTFLLCDTFLKAQNRPLNHWFESLMNAEPRAHESWLSSIHEQGFKRQQAPSAPRNGSTVYAFDLDLDPGPIVPTDTPRPALAASGASPRQAGPPAVSNIGGHKASTPLKRINTGSFAANNSQSKRAQHNRPRHG